MVSNDLGSHLVKDEEYMKDDSLQESGLLGRYTREFSRFLESIDVQSSFPIQLLIIKPEAIAAGYGAAMLKFLSRHQIRILRYRPFVLSPSMVEALYLPNLLMIKDANFGVRLYANVEQFCLGIAYVCFVTRLDGETVLDPYMTLERIKGPSKPKSQLAGQIRYEFSAPSRTLSLIHSSDSGVATFREAKVLGLENVLQNTLEEVKKSTGAAIAKLAGTSELKFAAHAELQGSSRSEVTSLRAFLNLILSFAISNRCTACIDHLLMQIQQHQTALSIDDENSVLDGIVADCLKKSDSSDMTQFLRSFRGWSYDKFLDAVGSNERLNNVRLTRWDLLVLKSCFGDPEGSRVKLAVADEVRSLEAGLSGATAGELVGQAPGQARL